MMWYKPSPATPEEDSYDYRLEWDDKLVTKFGPDFKITIEHLGPGSEDICGFDNAWEFFEWRKKDSDWVGVRLIRINPDGSESFRWY